jgi:acyl-coenzyme A synthetase/AMP-(fatty) acid ligase
MPDLPALVCGGSPIFGEEKQEAARRITANFMEVFGTTVTGGCTRLSASDLDGRADSVGRPLDLVELEVVDDTDRVLPPDTVGRLRIRTAGIGAPLIIPGRALPSQEDVRGGWSYTGELALLDAQGYLFIKGRTSDVIMRRGAKIMPAEIEAALLQHDAVAEAAVIGLPGDGADEDITAFCVVRRPLNGAELLAHCRARLTPYKTPQRIQIVESLPRNAGGKVAKAELAKLSGRPANTP